jgi:hypothetical protein
VDSILKLKFFSQKSYSDVIYEWNFEYDYSLEHRVWSIYSKRFINSRSDLTVNTLSPLNSACFTLWHTVSMSGSNLVVIVLRPLHMFFACFTVWYIDRDRSLPAYSSVSVCETKSKGEKSHDSLLSHDLGEKSHDSILSHDLGEKSHDSILSHDFTEMYT